MDCAELRLIKRKNDELNSLTNKINALRSVLTSTTQSYNGDVVQTSKNGDKIALLTTQIIDLKNKREQISNDLNDLKVEIFKKINLLESPYFEIIFKRYFEYKTWTIISRELNYSRQHIFRLYEIALKQIKDVT